MFHPDDIDHSDYPSRDEEAYITRRDADARYEREHECHAHSDCAAALDDTRQCEDCGTYFCDAHLYDGVCAACFAIEEQADELVFAEAA